MHSTQKLSARNDCVNRSIDIILEASWKISQFPHAHQHLQHLEDEWQVVPPAQAKETFEKGLLPTQCIVITACL